MRKGYVMAKKIDVVENTVEDALEAVETAVEAIGAVVEDTVTRRRINYKVVGGILVVAAATTAVAVVAKRRHWFNKTADAILESTEALEESTETKDK